ncbi:MAG: ATP-binding protein [Spirochaetaceae bacterium]|jgi:DNA helicase HerA-like ATPase|nr:ATP-binding protein [Spirochaetaceae bacterium]
MNRKPIGRVIATEKKPTSVDKFTFWTDANLILNPFDLVKVVHVNKSVSYGMIEDISHITDANSFLTGFISSDFGDVTVRAPTLRIGMNYVEAAIVCNDHNIYIPVQNDAEVYLASEEEITFALGLKGVKNPLPCGYLEMYENTGDNTKVTLPVNFNSKFVIGPEGAHLNISGISGLAAKTSYAMFLMKAIQDGYLRRNNDEDSVAFVLFNVKGKDLMGIDQPNDFLDEENPEKVKAETFALYKAMNLSPEPFKYVRYYVPFGSSDNSAKNSALSSKELESYIKLEKARQYVFNYTDDKENLDLFFANIDDTNQTIDAIQEYIIDGRGGFDKINDWNGFKDLVGQHCDPQRTPNKNEKEIPVVSWRKFKRIVTKAISHGVFTGGTPKNTLRLEEPLKKIRKNEVHVIDIANLSEIMQSFVFGYVIRTINKLQLGEYDSDDYKPPERILIFIDELNKYASTETPKNSPILRQILDVAERGRSLGVILFAAEQFRSAIHDRVKGNCATHAYGRTNAIETSKKDYGVVPNTYKNILTRLDQGEYLIQNPIFRSMLRIKFPKPIYKQFKS